MLILANLKKLKQQNKGNFVNHFSFYPSSSWFHSKGTCGFLLVVVDAFSSIVLVYRQGRVLTEKEGKILIYGVYWLTKGSSSSFYSQADLK